MLVDQNVVLAIFVACVVLPKSSEQEKLEDCIKGKQYWSTSEFLPSGTCAPCPHYWTNCKDQPVRDIKRCEDSCHVKPKPEANPAKKTSTPMAVAPTSLYTPPKLSKVFPNASIPVIYSSAVHLVERKEYRKPSLYLYAWVVILVAFLSVAIVSVVVVLLVCKFRKKTPKNRGQAHGNAGECVALRRPPIQATPSSLRIGGIQDTEENQGSSSLYVNEIHI